jgi:hypothetical protein
VSATISLLTGLVDYAGLFPPAQLDLTTALQEYDAHLRSADAGMLGRFVLPAGRLQEIEPWLDGPWGRDRPLRLSLLVTGEDLPAVAAFAARTPAVSIEALEVRPAAAGPAEAWLADLVARVEQDGLTGQEVYFELPAGRDHEVLAALGDRQDAHPLARLGAKLRCGGVTPDLIPPIARVAAVIAGARDRAVPLKFTAGLHHPVRGMDTVSGEPMHGFLNVYGAGLLAHVRQLTAAQLEPVLAETDPRAFRLDQAGLAWRDLLVPTSQIAAVRERLLGAYGSCSFDEPVTDLRALQMLA